MGVNTRDSSSSLWGTMLRTNMALHLNPMQTILVRALWALESRECDWDARQKCRVRANLSKRLDSKQLDTLNVGAGDAAVKEASHYSWDYSFAGHSRAKFVQPASVHFFGAAVAGGVHVYVSPHPHLEPLGQMRAKNGGSVSLRMRKMLTPWILIQSLMNFLWIRKRGFRGTVKRKILLIMFNMIG